MQTLGLSIFTKYLNTLQSSNETHNTLHLHQLDESAGFNRDKSHFFTLLIY